MSARQDGCSSNGFAAIHQNRSVAQGDELPKQYFGATGVVCILGRSHSSVRKNINVRNGKEHYQRKNSYGMCAKSHGVSTFLLGLEEPKLSPVSNNVLWGRPDFT